MAGSIGIPSPDALSSIPRMRDRGRAGTIGPTSIDRIRDRRTWNDNPSTHARGFAQTC
jgi:hypothetical protein